MEPSFSLALHHQLPLLLLIGVLNELSVEIVEVEEVGLGGAELAHGRPLLHHLLQFCLDGVLSVQPWARCSGFCWDAKLQYKQPS